MGKGCNKKQSSKNLEVAKSTTRKNKIRKFETIVRKNPNDHCAKNTLAQLKYDAGIK